MMGDSPGLDGGGGSPRSGWWGGTPGLDGGGYPRSGCGG